MCSKTIGFHLPVCKTKLLLGQFFLVSVIIQSQKRHKQVRKISVDESGDSMEADSFYKLKYWNKYQTGFRMQRMLEPFVLQTESILFKSLTESGGSQFLSFSCKFSGKNWPNNRLAFPPFEMALGNLGSATASRSISNFPGVLTNFYIRKSIYVFVCLGYNVWTAR